MMGHDSTQPKIDNRWIWKAWGSAAAVVSLSFVLGFVVLGRYQQNGPTLSTWGAICRAIGITSDNGPAGEPQPQLRTPSRIAWTNTVRAQIAAGSAVHGAFVAHNCGACHGEQGISPSSTIPTLAGMNSAVIYKQLDDFRSGKRLWGAMSAMATALSLGDSADVAAYFSARAGGLSPLRGAGLPESGRSLRQTDSANRLVFAGDPERGIPPCAVCHGPMGTMLGAPGLKGQQSAYIERELAAFAEGSRHNDINALMRTMASRLTPAEMHSVAEFYGAVEAAKVTLR